MKNALKSEPVVSAAAISALASAIVGLLVAFGLPLSAEEQESILTLVAVLAPFVGVVGAIIARRFVSPVDSEDTHRADV